MYRSLQLASLLSVTCLCLVDSQLCHAQWVINETVEAKAGLPVGGVVHVTCKVSNGLETNDYRVKVRRITGMDNTGKRTYGIATIEQPLAAQHKNMMGFLTYTHHQCLVVPGAPGNWEVNFYNHSATTPSGPLSLGSMDVSF